MDFSKKRAKQFGAYLKKIRKARNWSLRDVEAKTGNEISNAYLSQIERAERPVPSMSLISKLAHAFNLPIEFFLKEAGYIGEETSKSAEAHHLFKAYNKLSPVRRKLLSDFLGLLEKQEKQEKSQ